MASNGAANAREAAIKARSASRQLQALKSEDRVALLDAIADTLVAHTDDILAANAQDVESATGKITDSLLQRLILKPAKISQLADGIRSIGRQDEPLGRVISATQIAEDLELRKISVPIGVLLIIFEARPDALPQIVSLAIRSGNGLLLKGGKEAAHSNAILHRLISEVLDARAPSVGSGLVSLVTSRDDIDALLKLDDVIDLVIPRGGNALVSHIQRSTRIPVLGHADGICHVYVDAEADPAKALAIAVDSKADYPAACNAAETILVHASLADGLARELLEALKGAGVAVHAGPRAAERYGLERAASLRHEYSSLDVGFELVDDLAAAIDHIHAHGSSHTEVVVTENQATADTFLQLVDAACVHHNASSRFSDGFRYGLGAEVGISTGRIHARGPVGVEGLLTTKFVLRGTGQVVNKDQGVKYTHVARDPQKLA
ncbi:GSD1 [Auxenochlorella protothecoides x Auxenochlorella symbiontica]|uniref:glutamate-5-semialdehyde dehydrogenase n=1 Tax=Auxenochlorella protothecoides TaxID=3075 RepID=A0A1D1ZWJ7_AUXPR